MLTSRSCRRRRARGFTLVTCAGVFLAVNSLAGTRLSASDTVIVRSEPNGKERRITGVVVEFTGDNLQIRHPSGREEQIATDRVVEIRGDWKESHTAANALFAEGNFEAAEANYRQALRDEDRRWVQRRVLSQLVWCYRNLRRGEDAVRAFLPLYRDDPTTPYFDSLPLTWTTGQPELEVERQAAAWMQDQDSPAARLIGGSWLLSSPRRAEAISVLQQFAGNSDPRMVFLAEAQLWRTQVATSRPEDVSRWRERIEQMPASIRGGPYYVLGLACRRHEMHAQAAINFMRTAILYSPQRHLVADALLAAGRELETMKQSREAAGLYREILTKYETSRVASEAEARLQLLANEN